MELFCFIQTLHSKLELRLCVNIILFFLEQQAYEVDFFLAIGDEQFIFNDTETQTSFLQVLIW